MQDITKLSEIWRAFCYHVGLDGFETEVMKGHAVTYGDSEITVYLRKSIKLIDAHRAKTPEEFADLVLRPLIDKVQESSAVKDALSEMEKELKETKTALAEAEQKVSSLSQFKTHYDLSFALNHGKTNEGLKLTRSV